MIRRPVLDTYDNMEDGLWFSGRRPLIFEKMNQSGVWSLESGVVSRQDPVAVNTNLTVNVPLKGVEAVS